LARGWEEVRWHTTVTRDWEGGSLVLVYVDLLTKGNAYQNQKEKMKERVLAG